jgi:uncharacterized protein (TIGR02246 family)
MIPLLLAIPFLQGAQSVTALPPQPVIQAQLDAYNRHDAEAFAATYAPDAEIVELATGSLIAKGTAAIRAFYATRFQANPRLHAEVLHRVLQRPFVVDQERIAGAPSVPGGPECPPLTAVVVYELKDGSIARAMIVR